MLPCFDGLRDVTLASVTLRMLLAVLCGGIIGLGTIVCAFGLGPVIHFFDDHFTNKILQKPIFAKK